MAFRIKFVFSKKATKIDEIFTVDLTFTNKGQIDGEDFVNFCGLLRKHELYSESHYNLLDLIFQDIFYMNNYCEIQKFQVLVF